MSNGLILPSQSEKQDSTLKYIYGLASYATDFKITKEEKFYDIPFAFNYTGKRPFFDLAVYKDIAKEFKKYFSNGLRVTVDFDHKIDSIILSNNKISKEQLFDEYWNFREEEWFTLPTRLTNNRHLLLE